MLNYDQYGRFDPEELKNIAEECVEYTPAYNDSLTALSSAMVDEASCVSCAHFYGGSCDIFQRESGRAGGGDGHDRAER